MLAALAALGAYNQGNTQMALDQEKFKLNMEDRVQARQDAREKFQMELSDKQDARAQQNQQFMLGLNSQEKMEDKRIKSEEKRDLALLADKADERQMKMKDNEASRKSTEKVAMLDFAKTIGSSLLNARSAATAIN